MRRIIMVLLLALWMQLQPFTHGATAEPSTDPGAIQAEIRKIRKGTNWSDQQAVKKSNDQIQNLLRQLEKGRLQQEAAKAGAAPGDEGTTDIEMLNQATALEKIRESAAKGRGAGLDLGKELREKIVKEYEEERQPLAKSPVLHAELTTLVIDLSKPGAQWTIDLLDKFKSVDTLIITGGEKGAPVDLPAILDKAAKLPLKELQIINFRTHLTAIPETIGSSYASLTRLALFNNALRKLPAGVSTLKELSYLDITLNPVSMVMPTVKPLANLRQLDISATNIGSTERQDLQKALPQCELLR